METIQKRTWPRRAVGTLCTLALCFGLAVLPGCAGPAAQTPPSTDSGQDQPAAAESGTRTFVDSVGREVEVPAQLDRIAPSGGTAQLVLLSMVPDKLVGLSSEMTDEQLKYFGQEFAGYPVFGAIFGSKGDMNKEAVVASGAQIVIDTGEPKEGIKEDCDNLQQQLGIPVVFINTPLDDWSGAFTMLGELLGIEERGKELADYCAKAYSDTQAVMDTIPENERVRMAYLLGDAGQNAIAKGSYQGTIIDMCANNVVEVEKASGSGMGNEVSLEQVAVWNPDLIVFGAGSIYGSAGADPAWAGISAIETGSFYEVPAEPWVWLNNPPTVNQILGLQWFPRLCYPEKFDNDMQEVISSYYKTFYNCDLTQAEYDELTAKALPK